MSGLGIGTYQARHFNGVRALWEEAFTADPPYNRVEFGIAAKLAFQPDLFIVAEDDDEVIGTVMAGYDGHRGWLYTVAVRRTHRRSGIGSCLVKEAERRLQELGCPKVNLQVRTCNGDVIRFYQKLGYTVEERVSMGKRI